MDTNRFIYKIRVKHGFFFWLIFVSIATPCYGQLGFKFGYKNLDAKGWEKNIQRDVDYLNPYPMNGWEISLDYHLFGAKTKRLECYSEFWFSRFVFNKSQFDTTSIIEKLEHLQVGFQLSTRVYFLDIDCEYYCDTLTSTGSFFRKGLFVEGAPILVFRANYQRYDFSTLKFGWHFSRSFTFGGYLGMGLDLPITSKIMLSPVFRFYYFPNYSRWSDGNHLPLNIETSLKQFLVGCRFGYKFV